DGSGDAEVDLDVDSGDMSIDTDEGSLDIGSGEVPESFPDGVPLPEGDYSVTSSMEATDPDGAEGYIQLTLAAEGTADAQAEHLQQGLTDGGYEKTGTNRMESNGQLSVTISGRGHGQDVVMSVLEDPEGQVVVNYVVTASDE
ncbi:MAG: hypothetical protein L0H93_06505, partial [Nocardioides sp.]|nr:hypothetical protein [Nocardioides sp.]